MSDVHYFMRACVCTHVCAGANAHVYIYIYVLWEPEDNLRYHLQ